MGELQTAEQQLKMAWEPQRIPECFAVCNTIVYATSYTVSHQIGIVSPILPGDVALAPVQEGHAFNPPHNLTNCTVIVQNDVAQYP